MPQFLKSFKKIAVDILLPVAAFVISIISIFVAQAAQDDVARVEAVKTESGLYGDLARAQLDNPMLSHLFSVSGQSYDSQLKIVRIASSSMSDSEKAKLLLQERAMAHFIFTDYEETFYLRQQAQDGEKRRRQVLDDNLEFFNSYLCQNPRLLWYWDTGNGGKMGQLFGEDLRKYHLENVAGECPTTADGEGPFSSVEAKSNVPKRLEAKK